MAEFKYFLNRQGVRGPQGPQGEKGFSPDISVEKDTLSEYVLRITNEGGYFLTANLREHKEDRGGTYIRYDRDTGVMYTGDADPATTDTLGVIRIAKDDDFTGKAEDTAVTPAQVQDYTTAKIAEVNQRIDSLDANNVKVTGSQSIAGTKTFADGIVTDRVTLSNGNSVLRPDAGRIKIGSTSNTAGTKLEGPYVEVRGTNVDIYGKFTAHGFADFDYNTTFYQDAIIKGSVKDDNNNLYLKQNTITAGDNVQIVNTADGIKISSTAQGDVTLAGDNSFTGNNTFNKSVYLNSLLVGNSSTFGIKRAKDTSLLDYLMYSNDQLTRFGRASARTVIQGTRIQNGSNKNFLVQGSVTAGDNITVEETTDGIKISSTGGGAGDVTLAGDNSFTGNNTFDGETTFNAHTWTAEQEAVNLNVTSLATMKNVNISGTLTSNGEINAVSINAAGVKNNQNNKYYLSQASITAGSDNLSITETTDGVQITCYAATNAQIEALQRLINDLSTKIDNLTTRLNNLEEVIDGGVAGSIYPADPQKIDANPVVDSAINTGETSGSIDITVEDN